MSSEISANRALQASRSETNEKTRESQMRALNRRKESNSDHIRELDRHAFPKSKKSNPQHVQEVNRNAQNRKRSLFSGLNPSDHDLLQPTIKRPSCTPVNEIQEIECKNYIQEMQKMAKVIELISKITLNVVLNMYVLAVINYGIGHL